MKRIELKKRLVSGILILDGGMGTMLQPHLGPGACIDLANIERPDIVRKIHSEYLKAGANILSTNSFGANRIKLKEFGLQERMEQINRAAAELARSEANGRVLIAGVVGPTGKLIEPLGDLKFDEALQAYRDQATALAKAGVDIFLLETFSDLKEVKAAVIAIKESTELPVMACMTYGDDFLTLTGTDPETAANVLESLRVDAIGVNCSTGPGPMIEIVGRYAQSTDLPIVVEPNAGIPRVEDDKTSYQISQEEMASYGRRFVELGANIVGTCCGSTPEYTSLLSRELRGARPLWRKSSVCLKLSSRVKTVSIGPEFPFCIIGERINPTNRKDLTESLRSGRVDLVQQEAQSEEKEGAHVLDINVGVPGIDEAKVMAGVVRSIENLVRLPLSIDTTNPQAVEAALKECSGKPMINSVNGSSESMEKLLPLAAKYGSAILCLAIDEKGIPKSVDERIDILKRIVKQAEAHGIRREDLICDCLTLTVSAQQKRAQVTLRSVQRVKEELGLPTVLGVSNISYGLPERSLINAAFLSMAMGVGLDAAIINPGDPLMIKTVRAASVLTVRDKDSKAFIASHQKRKEKKRPSIIVHKGFDEIEEKIFNAVLSGNKADISHYVEKALSSGKSAPEINEKILIPAIQKVGDRYDAKEIFLPQMILSAESMQQAFSILEPHFERSKKKERGRVILCTVKGDIHDIGKNIVGLFLKNHGFEIIDLGKDVPVNRIVDETLKHEAQIVGLSALMTTTMTEMPRIINALREAKSDARVVVGGAVVTRRYAGEIKADGYAKDGVSAVEVIRELIEKSKVIESNKG